VRDDAMSEAPPEQLQRLLKRNEAEPDPDLVLSDGTLALSRRVWRSVAHPAGDLMVLVMVGLLHRARASCLPPERQLPDWAAATMLFSAVYRLAPDVVPTPIRDGFDSGELEVAPHADNYFGEFAAGVLQLAKGSSDISELTRAIDLLDEALVDTPPGGPGRVENLANLGAALRLRGERTSQASDVHRAVEVLTEALAASDTLRRNAVRGMLATALTTLGDQTGDLSDLERAVRIGGELVAGTDRDDPARARYLANLGAAPHRLAERTGDAADLERGRDVLAAALDATSADDPARPGRLSTLGGVLVAGYERTGDLAQLGEAIERLEEAVGTVAADDPERIKCLCNLGGARAVRYRYTDELSDLDRAIAVLEEAAHDAPQGLADRGRLLSNLGNALRSRWRREHRSADLKRAVEIGEAAVAASEEGTHERAVSQGNLAITLLEMAEQTGDRAALDRAIEVLEESLASGRDDDVSRVERLRLLGSALRHRSRPDDLKRALASCRQALRVELAKPLDRTLAAKEWAACAMAAGERDEAVTAIELAVNLVGEVAPLGLHRADRENRLAELAGLGSQAAAICLAAGQSGRAVELFEQGRGVLIAQALDARTDVTALEARHVELAARFTRLAGALDRSDLIADHATAWTDGADPHRRSRTADDREEVAQQLQLVITEIRAVPGFETFLRPRPLDQLLAVTSDGPVVLINVAEERSDAMILAPTGVDVIELDIQPSDVIDHLKRLLDAVADAQDGGPGARAEDVESKLADVLDWLWDAIAERVLERLGFTGPPDEGQPWPRVYWCPSGPLAFLPLHAAGRTAPGSGSPTASVMDRAVSSAIPTVRTLAQARRQPIGPAGDEDDRHRLLVVAMPETPGEPDLPGAAREAQLLADLFPGQVDILGLPDTPPATHATVMAALPRHAWAHLACHGASSMRNPSASHLLLQDHLTHPLTVLDLSQARLEDAELAFLSACTTARGGTDLPDETIHLAAGCLLAGYRHVIATLWPIGDPDALAVTRAVYRDLKSQSASREADAAAEAIHKAIHSFRHRYPHQPSRWASYVHAGSYSTSDPYADSLSRPSRRRTPAHGAGAHAP